MPSVLNLEAMASNLVAMASNLLAMASNLLALASYRIAMASLFGMASNPIVHINHAKCLKQSEHDSGFQANCFVGTGKRLG